MSKILLGIILGGILGVFDGLSALLCAATFGLVARGLGEGADHFSLAVPGQIDFDLHLLALRLYHGFPKTSSYIS